MMAIRRENKRPHSFEKSGSYNPTLAEVFDDCPYRTLLGVPPWLRDAPIETLMANVGAVFAAVGGKPEAIAAETVQSLINTLTDGNCVLLISSDAKLHAHARLQIMSAFIPVEGHA